MVVRSVFHGFWIVVVFSFHTFCLKASLKFFPKELLLIFNFIAPPVLLHNFLRRLHHLSKPSASSTSRTSPTSYTRSCSSPTHPHDLHQPHRLHHLHHLHQLHQLHHLNGLDHVLHHLQVTNFFELVQNIYTKVKGVDMEVILLLNPTKPLENVCNLDPSMGPSFRNLTLFGDCAGRMSKRVLKFDFALYAPRFKRVARSKVGRAPEPRDRASPLFVLARPSAETVRAGRPAVWCVVKLEFAGPRRAFCKKWKSNLTKLKVEPDKIESRTWQNWDSRPAQSFRTRWWLKLKNSGGRTVIFKCPCQRLGVGKRAEIAPQKEFPA